jgi:hypothetical protein
MTEKQAQFDFQFVIPTDDVLIQAQTLLQSDVQNHRDIAKVVTELTAIQKQIQDDISKDGTVDLAPWLDYWFGDTIETAQHLKQSDAIDVSRVAHILLDQEAAIIRSKESFLNEMKRLAVQPKHED